MTSFFIGRWQPLHDGHKALIQKTIDEGNDIVIGIRDIPPVKEGKETNPFSVAERVEMIEKAFGDSVGIVVIPEGDDGLEVIRGRKVGWSVREIKLDKETEKISGTKEREKMGIG